MVNKKRKSFIDKNHATTFRVLHRSQRDPLVVDDEVGQHVLHPVPTTVFVFVVITVFKIIFTNYLL